MNLMFHQLYASPHIVPLAEALAESGHRVVFLTYGEVSNDRMKLGWSAPPPKGCEYHSFSNERDILAFLQREAGAFEHICQGLRANGLVSIVQSYLKRNGIGFIANSEVVDEAGFLGRARKLIYRSAIMRMGEACKGVLAIGERAPSFFHSIGIPSEKVYHFAYFVRDFNDVEEIVEPVSDISRILFVGQLIHRKGVDLLIRALREAEVNYELDIVGSGESERSLRGLLSQDQRERVRFHGSVPIENVGRYMLRADCLVLPSRFDGWGAVLSESISRGTAVVCSDSCGASGAVKRFPGCFVFKSGDIGDLRDKLLAATSIPRTRQSRRDLAALGRRLTATAGAEYLTKIIESKNELAHTPVAPWLLE